MITVDADVNAEDVIFAIASLVITVFVVDPLKTALTFPVKGVDNGITPKEVVSVNLLSNATELPVGCWGCCWCYC